MSARAVAVALVAAVFLLVILVARSLRFPPDLPADSDHRRGQGAEECLSCHGPEGTSPRGKNHPLNDQCFNCHSWPAQR
ncbi:MAG: hypothetical protein HY509_03600 [Acidobacteria bacterium]|nr:hypothetical protein [Acidobacteriota bacterium]